MNEKSVSPATGEPLKVQNFYFQIILGKLISKKAIVEPLSYLRFSIFKGKQKFESTKNVPAIFVDNELELPNLRLNFVVLNYNPAKVQEFSLKISHIFEQSEKELGEYIIDCNSYIDHYKQTENGAFVNQWDLGQPFALDIEIYVEKSRYGVEKLHREVKNPKGKRPDEQPIVVPLQKILPRRRERTNLDSSLQKSIEKTNRFTRVSPKKDARLQISKRLDSSKKKKDILIEQPPIVKKKESSEVKRLVETPKKIQTVKASQVSKPSQIMKPAEVITQTPVIIPTETVNPVEIDKPIQTVSPPEIKQTCYIKPQPQIAEVVQVKKEQLSQDKSVVQKKNSEQIHIPVEISVSGSKNQANPIKEQSLNVNEPVAEGSLINSKVREIQKVETSAVEQVKPSEVPQQKKQAAQIPEEKKQVTQVSEQRPGFKLQYPSFMKDCPLNIKFIAPIFLLLWLGFIFIIYTVFSSPVIEPIQIKDSSLLGKNQASSLKESKKVPKTSQKANIKTIQSASKAPSSKVLKPTLKSTKVQTTPTETATYIPSVIPPSETNTKKASNSAKIPKKSSNQPQVNNKVKEEIPKVSTKVKEPKLEKTAPNPSKKPVNTKLNNGLPSAAEKVPKASVTSTTASKASSAQPTSAADVKKGKKSKN